MPTPIFWILVGWDVELPLHYFGELIPHTFEILPYNRPGNLLPEDNLLPVEPLHPSDYPLWLEDNLGDA